MPELPEVETVKNGLLKIIDLNSKIKSLKFRRKDLRFPFDMTLKKKVIGQNILDIQRRAKYLLISLSNDLTLISHLGMTGSWRKLQGGEKLKTHDHVIIDFEDGTSIIYNDPRRFGFIDSVNTSKLSENKFLSHLGPEPLSDDFNTEYLSNIKKNKSVMIKNLIMNQQVVVGVGNIYAAESLFLSRIRPTRRASTLTRKECELLVTQIKKTIKTAIEVGGSTINDFISAEGETGYFQHEFKVYGKDGHPCSKCLTPLKNVVISGRASVYCMRCQK